MTRRVVVAPDSFKGSASAREIAHQIADGWRRVRPDDELVLVPMADGGEGTVEALATATPGAVLHRAMVTGPLDRAVEAFWLELPDRTGVIELAAGSGLLLTRPLSPETSHTIGAGELIVRALEAGCDRIVVGLGGSSSTDGGMGLLYALGARFFDADGEPVRRGNIGAGAVSRVDRSGLRELPARGVLALTDVTNPLLGPAGAAAVFGPQKGASDVQVVRMGEALQRWRRHFPETDDASPGTGAAGGAGFGLLAWGARLTAGAPFVARQAGLPQAVAGADLVITGEGRFDSQTAGGKVPRLVLDLARDSKVPCALIAGQILGPADDYVAARALVDVAGDEQTAMGSVARVTADAAQSLASALGGSLFRR